MDLTHVLFSRSTSKSLLICSEVFTLIQLTDDSTCPRNMFGLMLQPLSYNTDRVEVVWNIHTFVCIQIYTNIYTNAHTCTCMHVQWKKLHVQLLRNLRAKSYILNIEYCLNSSSMCKKLFKTQIRLTTHYRTEDIKKM